MSYSLTKQLPSCLVERKLLSELENYLQRKAADFTPPDSKFGKSEYKFTIVDSSGAEVLKSVEEFKRTYFPDDTNRIKLNYNTVYRRGLTVEVSFDVIPQLSKLEIQFDGDSAREVATGIAAEILSILDSYKTSNRFFNYYSGAPIAVAVNTILLLPLWVYLLPRASGQNFAALVVTIVMSAVLVGIITPFVIRNFKPYSTFETRRNERRKKQLSWIVLGFLGFILFTVVGVYFRQRLFGF